MTGLGAYFYIVWGIWLRYCLNGQQDLVRLDWPSIFSVPEVVRVDVLPKVQANGNGKAYTNGNGHAANGESTEPKKTN
jgi:dihydroceramidase